MPQKNQNPPKNYLFVKERISLDGLVSVFAELYEYDFQNNNSGPMYELARTSTRILSSDEIEERYKDFHDLAEMLLIERVRKIFESQGGQDNYPFLHQVPPEEPILRTLIEARERRNLGEIYMNRKFSEPEERYFSEILNKVGYEFRDGRIMQEQAPWPRL